MNNLNHTASPLSSPEIVLILMLAAFVAWAVSGFVSRFAVRSKGTALFQWATVWIFEIVGGLAGLVSFLALIGVAIKTWQLPWYVVLPMGFVYVFAIEKVQVSGKARFEIISKSLPQMIRQKTPARDNA